MRHYWLGNLVNEKEAKHMLLKRRLLSMPQIQSLQMHIGSHPSWLENASNEVSKDLKGLGPPAIELTAT
jgi:hypothetical protein